MDKVYGYLMMELYTMALLNLGNLKVLVLKNTLMGMYMKENGKMGIRKDKENLNGLVEMCMKVSIKKVKGKVMEYVNMLMEMYMKVNGKMGIRKDKENLNGLMDMSKMVNGRKLNLKVME